MAQALLRKTLAEDQGRELQGIAVCSAGLGAFPGQPASPEALRVMKSHGIDLSQHRSRVLEEKMVQEADLILTMTSAQARQLIDLYPPKRSSIYTLTEFTGRGLTDVMDPYGAGINVYMRTAKQIKELIEEVFERVKRQKKSMGDKT